MLSKETPQQEEGNPSPPDSERSDRRDSIGALLLICVSVAFAFAALRMPFQNPGSWEWYTSPGIFALAMAICLGSCSLVIGYRGLRGWLKNWDTNATLNWNEELRRWGMGRFLASVGIVLVYLLLLGRVPFLVASVALILVFGTVFRGGRFLEGLRPAAIAAFVVVIFSYVIMKVFGIVFP